VRRKWTRVFQAKKGGSQNHTEKSKKGFSKGGGKKKGRNGSHGGRKAQAGPPYKERGGWRPAEFAKERKISPAGPKEKKVRKGLGREKQQTPWKESTIIKGSITPTPGKKKGDLSQAESGSRLSRPGGGEQERRFGGQL